MWVERRVVGLLYSRNGTWWASSGVCGLLGLLTREQRSAGGSGVLRETTGGDGDAVCLRWRCGLLVERNRKGCRGRGQTQVGGGTDLASSCYSDERKWQVAAARERR